MQVKNDLPENKKHKSQIKARERIRLAVILTLIVSICIILISTIGVSPKSEAIAEVSPSALPVFAPPAILPSAEEEQSLVTEIHDECIVIDPGHGGIDPGCFIDDAYEDEINLSISLLLKASLEKFGYEVKLTREGDETISINNRVKFASDSNADLIISIHQNAYEDDTDITGIETWYNKKSNESNQLLAQYIQEGTITATGANDRGLVLSRALDLTRKSKIPSCLIETGFITNSLERNKLISIEYQEKIADGIAAGINRFFEEKE